MYKVILNGQEIKDASIMPIEEGKKLVLIIPQNPNTYTLEIIIDLGKGKIVKFE